MLNATGITCTTCFRRTRFWVCGRLDIAGWGYYGQNCAVNLCTNSGKLDFSKAPLTDYTIGIDSIEKMVREAAGKTLAHL